MFYGEAPPTSSLVVRAVMQGDGNFVIYRFGGAIWHTRTNGNSGARLVLQNDGNLVVYTPGNTALWYTGTNGRL